jgi:hypothetical protein
MGGPKALLEETDVPYNLLFYDQHENAHRPHQEVFRKLWSHTITLGINDKLHPSDNAQTLLQEQSHGQRLADVKDQRTWILQNT